MRQSQRAERRSETEVVEGLLVASASYQPWWEKELKKLVPKDKGSVQQRPAGGEGPKEYLEGLLPQPGNLACRPDAKNEVIRSCVRAGSGDSVQ